VKNVPCPRCGAPAAFTPANQWRPFCSERCKLVDLGDWASERYKVPLDEQGSEAPAPDPEDPPAR
jgi:endogenous inhibitor of DNA gyrase (YacG/DUF329 family)